MVRTCGRRRKAAGLAVAALVAVSVVLAGCGQGGSLATGAGSTSPAAGRTSPVASSSPPGGRQASVLRFCQAHQSTVASVLGGLVPDSQQSEFVPLGAASRREAYVSAWTPDFAGVAELTLRSGRLRPIQRFARPASDQADGAASGRWLVWAQTYSLTSLDRFTMYDYNASTGRVSQIGRSLSKPDGVAWASPWHAPAVSGSYAAWAQGYAAGVTEIELASLATGEVTTIARGHLQPPFFDGDLVVWPQSDSPDSPTALHAYSLATHAVASLPPVLAGVRGTDEVVTDGTRTAYLSPDFTRLYYSPDPDVPARPAVRLPTGADFTDLALAPGALAWTTSSATYLASTRTGAFIQVTPQYGYATGSSSVMLITDAPSGKSVHPALPTYVVDPVSFSWPSCTSG